MPPPPAAGLSRQPHPEWLRQRVHLIVGQTRAQSPSDDRALGLPPLLKLTEQVDLQQPRFIAALDH